MLRTGAVVLTVWTAFNGLLAFGIVVAVGVFGQNAPALLILFSDASGSGIESRALATINALAVLFNACAAAACGLSLALIWTSLVRRERWAFWSLLAGLGFIQLAGFASDAILGNKNLAANLVSAGVLTTGLVLAGYDLRRQRLA